MPRIYTKTGDDGTTGLLYGGRVSKADLIPEACGTLDEAVAVLARVGHEGKVLAGGRLEPKRHRQPEGLAVAPDLTLLISDEAAGAKATITGYASRR